MASLFGSKRVPKIPTPKPVRLPTIDDPDIIAQGLRAKAARGRTGRDSTVKTSLLSDALRSGSTGRSLGA